MITARARSVDARSAAQVGRGRAWVGLWGGGVVWLLHFLSIWALAEFGCLGPLARPGALGVSVVAWLVLAVTALALALAGAATWLGWHTERRARSRGAGASDPAEAVAFAARVGWVAGALFTFVILIEAVPVLFYLRGCGDVGAT